MIQGNFDVIPVSRFLELDGTHQRLESEPCSLVMLSLWTTDDDTEQTPQPTRAPVIFGFGDVYAHQLFPGTTSEIYPIKNLNLIRVKASQMDAPLKLFYTFWK